MHLSRRKFIGSMAALSAGAMLPSIAHAESVWDLLEQNRLKKSVNAEGSNAEALALIDTPEPILSFDTAYNLQLAITYYEKLAASDAWVEPTRATFGLQITKEGRAVVNLKRYLIALQDMPAAKTVSSSFDAPTDAALRKFQVRHGIVPTGKVDEATFYALAVSPTDRLAQLRLNALRVEALVPALQERYLLINIPAASIETVQAGQVYTRHTAVCGKVDRPTPIMSSKIHQVKFNPYWTVPKSIIEKDLIRYMNEDPEYLAKFHIRIFDGKGNEVAPTDLDWSSAADPLRYTFRQDPGGENSMGHCKIDFYNPYDCYLHDTPAKALFGENTRFYSSGCVRAQNIDQIAAWVLGDNGGWDITTVQAMFESNESVNVPLTFQMPLHTTYITAWANRNGAVSFRDDIYGYDAAGTVVFEKA
ncbi:MAG: L,D-transpeptidase family protein [Devosia sp.]